MKIGQGNKLDECMKYNTYTYTYTLSNGIRLIHKPDKMSVVYCGMIINAGSRDEKPKEQGLAHFVEHLLFKGTSKRRSGHIINRIENVGGELNAFTSKEETVVFAAVLKDHFEKTIDLLGDIVFHSVFPPKELEKEKIIILDEIQSYNDSPAELIFDDFEEMLFDFPIGHNILGVSQTLESFQTKDAKSFVDNFYLPEEIVFFVIGDIREASLLRWAEKYLVNGSSRERVYSREVPKLYKPNHQEFKRNTFQIHYVLGNRSLNIYDKDRVGMYMLNNILGGPGMNSLLNLSLREKNGLVYNVDSYYTPMTDAGYWAVYFGCDADNFTKCEKLVRLELRKLREDILPHTKLEKYKLQLIGQIALSMEHKDSYSISLGRNLLRYGEVDSFDEIKEKIMSITGEQLQKIAQKVFNEDSLSSLKYY